MIDKISYNTKNANSDIASRHFHNGYEILYIADGCVKVEIDGYPHTVKAPSVILLNPFEWHRIPQAIDGQYKRYTLVLDPVQFEQSVHTHFVTMVKCRPTGFSHVIRLSAEAQKTADAIFEVLMFEEQHEHPYKEQLIINEIYNLFILLYRCTTARENDFDERMLQIQRYIDSHYQTIENVQSLAQQFYLSREHFARTFKEFSGYSPMEYLLHTRLYHAQLILLHTQDSIAEICEETGFHDLSNFIRQFKKKYSVSPLTFRKNHQSE